MLRYPNSIQSRGKKDKTPIISDEGFFRLKGDYWWL